MGRKLINLPSTRNNLVIVMNQLQHEYAPRQCYQIPVMQGVREGVTRYNDQGGGVRGKGGGGGGKIIDNCRGIRTQKKKK